MMGKLKQHLYGTADDIKDLHEGPQLRSKLIPDRNGRDMRDVLALMSGHVNNREGSLHRISQRGHGIHRICSLVGKEGCLMACSVCAGYIDYDCPCCGETVNMIECPDCEDGFAYYAFNIKTRQRTRCTKITYIILPYDEDDAKYEGKTYCQGDIEPCPTCKGEGEIPEDL